MELIAAMPVNQPIMAKLAMNSALYQQGWPPAGWVSTVFDGDRPAHPEGHAFVVDAVEHGFREAVRHRDEPFGDFGRKARGLSMANTPDDGSIGGALRASRCPPGLGHHG